jgi:hypothetical protein
LEKIYIASKPRTLKKHKLERGAGVACLVRFGRLVVVKVRVVGHRRRCCRRIATATAAGAPLRRPRAMVLLQVLPAKNLYIMNISLINDIILIINCIF